MLRNIPRGGGRGSPLYSELATRESNPAGRNTKEYDKSPRPRKKRKTAEPVEPAEPAAQAAQAAEAIAAERRAAGQPSSRFVGVRWDKTNRRRVAGQPSSAFVGVS